MSADRRRRWRASGRKVVIGVTSAGQGRAACVPCPTVPLRWVSAGPIDGCGSIKTLLLDVTNERLRRQMFYGPARRDATTEVRGADVDQRRGDNAGLQSLVLRSQRRPNDWAFGT